MKEHFISDEQALIDICQYFSTQKVLAVDTEFVRTRTFYPKLGLIQVSDGEQVVLIDPLTIDDLTPFWDLINNPDITKVLHACSEDIEIFIQQGKCNPKGVIDSQIVMSFLGHGLSLGYASMVEHYLGLSLDKSDSRTDWTKRPLSESQMEYAKADVIHLVKLFPRLMADLEKTPWQHAVMEETQLLINKKMQTVDIETLYTQVKMAWKLQPAQLNNLKFLAKWRFEQATSRDLPLSFVAKDATLTACAQYAPISIGAMARLNGVDTLDVRHRGKNILSVLRQAAKITECDYPQRIKRIDTYPGYKQNYKKIKEFVSATSSKLDLPAENLASKKQINQFMSWYYKQNTVEKDVELLSGWRYAIVGEALIASAKQQFANLS